MNWKDILIRALKTGGQAAIATLIALLPTAFSGVSDFGTARAAVVTLLVAVLSAGVSAAWNIIMQAVSNKGTA